MKITICLSIKFYQEMLDIKKRLEEMGHGVLVPPHEVPDENGKMMPVMEYYKIRKEQDEDWIWQLKKQAMNDHFKKVNQADAILVFNLDKNNVKNYIGANTLLEMGLAFWLNKPIFLFNPIPEELGYAEEIKGMQPVVICGDLGQIEKLF